jgi:four helix bundle protein
MKQSKSIVGDKAFAFAIMAVEIFKQLQADKEYILSKQFLRSATSIGANIEEASAAQSKKDFIAKMCISSKEARETHYWLRLLTATNYLKQNDVSIALLEEIINMLTSIIKTSQKNLTQNPTLNPQN